MYNSNQPMFGSSESEKDYQIRELKSSVNTMLIYVIAEVVVTVFYFLLSIFSRYLSSATSSGRINFFSYSKYIYTTLHLIELIIIIVVASLIRHNTARVWFIVLAAIKFIATAFWTYNYFA